MDALARAMRSALEASGVRGDQVSALALDATGSSVIPVGEGFQPLDDYYLWCDHRAAAEAEEITAAAHQQKLEAIDWYDKPNKVFDRDAGIYGRWFTGGTCNTCYNAVDRQVLAGRGQRKTGRPPRLVVDSASGCRGHPR